MNTANLVIVYQASDGTHARTLVRDIDVTDFEAGVAHARDHLQSYYNGNRNIISAVLTRDVWPPQAVGAKVFQPSEWLADSVDAIPPAGQ